MAHAVLIFESIYVDRAWAQELEEKIHRVIETLVHQVDHPPEDRSALIPTPSGEEFDGCPVCIRREIMVMTVMATIDAVPQGLVERPLVA